MEVGREKNLVESKKKGYESVERLKKKIEIDEIGYEGEED